jgi:heme o synthase
MLQNTLKTYYHLTKPGIVYSNVLTAAAGYLLASKWQVDAWQLVALLTGIALVIASGCVFNNYLDRSIDQKMARTKKRATVTGEISGTAALIYATCLGTLGFGVLWYTNVLVIGLGLGALFGYVILYGIAKRTTIFGTLVGTLPGAASLVAGYVAVTYRLDLGALLLFLIMASWQMPHFYAIAMRRFDDYKAAGLMVWPVKRGIVSTKRQIILFVAVFLIANIVLGLTGYTGYTYSAVIGGLGLYWLWRGLRGLQRTDNQQWARGMFGLSLIILLSLSVMLALAPLLP